jgi:hypothetical protein
MLGTPIVDGAPEDRHASHLRESFSHEFHPFAGQLVILGCKPGGVPSRSGEARDKGERYRIGDDRHHDRDRDRRLLGSQGGLAGRDDDVHLEADQLGREVWEPIASSLGKPVLDTDVTTFDITELAEALLKGFDKGSGGEPPKSTPMRASRPASCARAPSGAARKARGSMPRNARRPIIGECR